MSHYDIFQDWKTTQLSGEVLDYLGELVSKGVIYPVSRKGGIGKGENKKLLVGLRQQETIGRSKITENSCIIRLGMTRNHC